MEKPQQVMSIFVTAEFEAFHCWPDAPVPVDFLRHTHRHLFKVKVVLQVTHHDRQLEFLTVRQNLIAYVRSKFERTWSTKSCEQFAQEIYDGWAVPQDFPVMGIEVSEDGENGAYLIVQPTKLKTTVTLPPVPKIKSDGLCDCDVGSPCPLGKMGSDARCSETELTAGGHASIPYTPEKKPEESPITSAAHRLPDMPIHTVVRDYCFVGIEAEGQFREEAVLYVPASFSAKKLGKVFTKLSKTTMEMPTRIYIGAGNDWIRNIEDDDDHQNVLNLLKEVFTFANDRNDEADDFGLPKVIRGIDVEISSWEDLSGEIVDELVCESPERELIRVISRTPSDISNSNVCAVKCIRNDGKIHVIDKKDKGTIYQSEVGFTADVDSTWFDYDIRVNKEFFKLAEEFGKRRPMALTGRPTWPFFSFVPFVRTNAKHLFCSPTLPANKPS